MNNNLKEFITMLVVILWCILVGFGFGILIRQKELEKQIYINTQLELEYNDLRSAYDYLEFNCKK